jgi:hypothetical protein
MTSYEREDGVENYLVKRVKEEGGRAYKFTSPGRRNVPDRLCALPKRKFKEPLVLWELKSPDVAKLREGQEHEVAYLAGLGIVVRVAWTKAMVDELIEGLRRG